MKKFFTLPFFEHDAHVKMARNVGFLLLCQLFLLSGALKAQNITPVVSSYSPQCTFAGEAFVLTITGTDFRTDYLNQKVRLELTTTTGQIVYPAILTATSTQLTVSIPASAQTTAGSLTFRVQNEQGNKGVYNSSLSKSIPVYAPPVAADVLGSRELCDGDIETYSISPVAGFSYRWVLVSGNASFPNGNTGSSVNVAVEFGPGDGTVQLGVFATAPCGWEQQESTKFSVLVNPLPVINQINASSDLICSPGELVQLNADATPVLPGSGITYDWELNNIPLGNYPNTQTQNNGEIVLSPYPGEYTLTVSNDAGCTATSSITINQGIKPGLPTTTDADRCGPGELTLTAAPSDATPVGSYLWYTTEIGGAPIAGETSASFTTNFTSTTSYWVAIQSADGCISERAMVTATVNFQPQVSLSGITALCEGTATTLTANITNDPGGISFGFAWFKDNVQIPDEDLATLAVSDAGAYRVEVSTPEGCSASATQTINVTPAPTINIASSNDNYCAGGSTQLTASGAQTYSWSPATGLSATTGAVVTASPTTTTEYTVKGTDASGCTNEETVVVNVKPLPTFSIQSSVTQNRYCPGEEVTLTIINEAIPTATYSWSTVGNPNFTTGTEIVVNPVGSTVYAVEAVADGCTYNTQISLIQRNGPTASIAEPDVICDGSSITLVGNGGVAAPHSITYYEWFYNDENSVPIAEGPTTNSIDVNTAGTYFLRVSSSNGCTSSFASREVTASTTPATPLLSGNPAFCTSDGGTTLSVSNFNGAYTYQWLLEGTPINGQTEVTLLATTSGNYSVEATNAGCSSTSAAFSVTEVPNPTLSISPNTFVACEGAGTLPYDIRTFGAAYPANELSYFDGNGVEITIEANFLVSTPGTYNYTIVRTVNGCSSEAAATVTINALPVVAITSPTATDMLYTGAPGPVNLLASPPGGTFYINDLQLSGNSMELCNPTINNALNLGVGGVNTLRYEYTDAATGCSNSTEITLNIQQSTYEAVITANPFTICRGQNTSYTSQIYRVEASNIIYPYTAYRNGVEVPPNEILYQFYAEYVFEYNLDHPEVAAVYASNPNDVRLAFPHRFFQPYVASGTDLIGAANASKYLYQWTKNDGNQIGPDRITFNNAGLSSTDYYRVYIDEQAINPLCDVSLNQIGLDNGWTYEGASRGIRSNPLWLGQPQGYEISLAAVDPICQGDFVEFTALLGQGEFATFWENANVQISWYLSRDGEPASPILLAENVPLTSNDNPTIDSDLINARLAALNISPAELIDGDEIYLTYTSDLSNSLTGKCSGVQNSLNVAQIEVNSIAPEATGFTGSLCATDVATATYSVDPNATGSGALTISWELTDAGNNIIATGSGTDFNLPANLAAGNYTISLEVSKANALGGVCDMYTTGFAIEVLDIAPFEVLGGADYCELSVNEQLELYISSSQPTVNYILSVIDEGGNVVYTDTQNGDNSGGPLYFSTAGLNLPGGNYSLSVEASYLSGLACTETMAGTTSVNVASAVEVSDGNIEAWFTSDEAVWELRLVNNTYAAQLDALLNGATPQYLWEIIPEGGTQFIAVTDNDTDPNNVLVPANITDARLTLSPPAANPAICMLNQVLTTTITTPLPVDMLYFRANKEGANVILSWATSKEENNLGFNVQVSNNGFNYRSLAFVPTKDGNGIEQQTYAYVDAEPNKYGTRYYRLEQQDIDGQTEFFGPIAVFINDNQQIMARPNPFQDRLHFTIMADEAGEANITLHNANGRLMGQYTLPLKKGSNEQPLILDNHLPSGMYLVTTQIGGFIQHFKLMKK